MVVSGGGADLPGGVKAKPTCERKVPQNTKRRGINPRRFAKSQPRGGDPLAPQQRNGLDLEGGQLKPLIDRVMVKADSELRLRNSWPGVCLSSHQHCDDKDCDKPDADKNIRSGAIQAKVPLSISKFLAGNVHPSPFSRGTA